MSKKRLLIASVIALLTFFVFLPALWNGFVNWDDQEYVYENSFIRAIDARLLRAAFLEFHSANWHPLTWISHALDYRIWGLNAAGHHLTSILLHACNAFLVVLLALRLAKTARNPSHHGLSGFSSDRAILLTGGVTGLLFGLHPLHVESVAWISERKDLLCALFFLFTIMAYVKAEVLAGGMVLLRTDLAPRARYRARGGAIDGRQIHVSAQSGTVSCHRHICGMDV